jgi:long-chain acyl-CoA synthetase
VSLGDPGLIGDAWFASAFGIPHPHYGEEVAAVVVVRPGSPQDGPAITAWSRERLSAYKIPRVVHFVDELPKGSRQDPQA